MTTSRTRRTSSRPVVSTSGRPRHARRLAALGLAGALACVPIGLAASPASAAEAWMYVRAVTFNAGGPAVWMKTTSADRCAMARTVTQTSPGVILFQEVTMGSLPDKPGRRMLDDVIDLMKNTSCTNGYPYTWAATSFTPTDTPLTTRSGPKTEGDFGVGRTRSTQIFYDPRRVTFVGGDSRPLWQLLPEKITSGTTVRYPQEEYLRLLQVGGDGERHANSKYFSKARFQVKGGDADGRNLVVADLHLPCLTCVTDQAKSQELQVMMMQGLLNQIQDKSAPLIVGGDLNQRPNTRPTDPKRDLRGALEAGGLRDSRDLAGNTSNELEGIYVRGARASSGYLGTQCTAYHLIARQAPYDHPTVRVRVGMRVS